MNKIITNIDIFFENHWKELSLLILVLLSILFLYPNNGLLYLMRNTLTSSKKTAVGAVKGASDINNYAITPAIISPSPSFYIVTPTQDATNYNNIPTLKNGGWYQHDGQSMQYLNGTWYTAPQQGNISPTIGEGDNTTDPLVSCTICTGTFQMTQSDCDYNHEFSCTSPSNTQTSVIQSSPANQPTPTQTQNNNGQYYQQCVSNAQSQLSSSQQSCNSTYGGGSSAGPACYQIAQSTYNQQINNCSNEYPH